MEQPAVFLDRDGTLIEDRGHLNDPSQVAFFPETFEALRRLGGQFLLFIVTNQNGIAKGITTPEGVRRVNDFVVRRLADEGIQIREVYCCPHERSDGCACIKPNPYFPRQAERDHGVDLARSYMVGDHPPDVELAANVGAEGVFVLSGHGAKHRHELRIPCEVVGGIAEAADSILVSRAVRTLQAGGLVAFPTETVYGLGADAEKESAVRRIFQVKGRPSTHPLIVHLGDPWPWAKDPPPWARRLAERFWPGPLTLVVRRNRRSSDAVTGGQETVGLRVPSHALALRLLRAFGGGIAAPSANRFGKVSPTTAAHVRSDLGSEVDFILDGGPSEVGVESTIVDCSGAEPAILRPGGVTREAIELALGRSVEVRGEGEVRASGQLESHYAPRAEVVPVSPGELEARAAELRTRGLKVEVLREPEAATLYASLREADRRGADAIVVVLPAPEGLGLAVRDRIRKASGPRG